MNAADLARMQNELPELECLMKNINTNTMKKMNILEYQSGTVLYREGDFDTNSIFIVLFGVCKIFGRFDHAGGPLYFDRGSVVGTYEALSSMVTMRTAGLGSFTNTRLLEIPKDVLQNDIFTQNRELFFWIVIHTIQKYHTNYSLVNTIQGDVTDRICGYLLDVYRMCYESTDGTVTCISISDTQATIAACLRTSVRSVTRAVNAMRASGLLMLNKRKIIVDSTHYKLLEEYLFKNH